MSNGTLGEPFPNPNDDKPSPEEEDADLQREAKEIEGELPPPWKTFPFWLSLVASVLAYLAASQALPVQINEWVLVAIVALGHLGYGTVAKKFAKNPEGVKIGTPNWKRPAFYASFSAVLASYAMGSGYQEAASIGGQAAVMLAYVGVAVRPWIRRKTMMTLDDEEQKVSFFQKVLEILLFVSRKRELAKK